MIDWYILGMTFFVENPFGGYTFRASIGIFDPKTKWLIGGRAFVVITFF
jgi:hypothetical protein